MFYLHLVLLLGVFLRLLLSLLCIFCCFLLISLPPSTFQFVSWALNSPPHHLHQLCFYPLWLKFQWYFLLLAFGIFISIINIISSPLIIIKILNLVVSNFQLKSNISSLMNAVKYFFPCFLFLLILTHCTFSTYLC